MTHHDTLVLVSDKVDLLPVQAEYLIQLLYWIVLHCASCHNTVASHSISIYFKYAVLDVWSTTYLTVELFKLPLTELSKLKRSQPLSDR